MWKKLSSKILFEHPRLLVEEDQVELKSGEVINYLRYGYGGDGVVLVAVNSADEMLFVGEYSYVPNKKIIQLPMGKVEPEESYEQAANRELQEETNFKANKLSIQGSYYQNHRRASNKGVVVLATDLEESSLQSDQEEEEIEVIWVPIKQIPSLIEKGEIIDADTLASLSVYSLKC